MKTRFEELSRNQRDPKSKYNIQNTRMRKFHMWYLKPVLQIEFPSRRMQTIDNKTLERALTRWG